MDATKFIETLRWDDLPQNVQSRLKLGLLDIIGVATGGAETDLSKIIRDYSTYAFGGAQKLMFDGRTASAPGVALAAGMTIDALDSHDGFNPSKGHIGCSLFSTLFALAQDKTGEEFLTAWAIGYEIGSRVAMSQHATVPDYHTSGSWGAVASAAAAGRLLGVDAQTLNHALGIAEYHGPRSQMMRCIDHPTMVKDGSGWGAMTAVTALQLAQMGFTGAPALTFGDDGDWWSDLGDRWYAMEQYYKPYPVCRWAQAPIEAVLELRRKYDLAPTDVSEITVETFHESIRLATAEPATTEEAQYSTSFPCAVALVHGDVQPQHITGNALHDAAVLRLSRATKFIENEHANAVFPGKRIARVMMSLHDGTTLTSEWKEPRWDHDAPPTAAELTEKFRSLAQPRLGKNRADQIEDAVASLERRKFADLSAQLFQPINRCTSASMSS